MHSMKVEQISSKHFLKFLANVTNLILYTSRYSIITGIYKLLLVSSLLNNLRYLYGKSINNSMIYSRLERTIFNLIILF